MIYFSEKKTILADIMKMNASIMSDEQKELFTSQMLDVVFDIAIKKPIHIEVQMLKTRIEDLQNLVYSKNELLRSAKARNTVLKKQVKYILNI